MWARMGAALGLVCLLLPAGGTWAGEPKVDHVDASKYPDVRLVIDLQGAAAAGQAEVEIAEHLSASELDGLKKARELKAAATASAPYKGPEIPEDPIRRAPAVAKAYAEHDDPKLGTTVVCVVDVTTSMRREERLDKTKGLLRALAGRLRPIDRMAIVSFTDHSSVVLELTGDQAQIRRAIDGIELGGRNEQTKIYEAVMEAYKRFFAEPPASQYPSRRFLFVFSDGDDKGSSIQPRDIGDAVDRFADPPQLYAVGVGKPSDHGDLKRVASVASATGKFLETPEQPALAAAYDQGTAALQRQAQVAFTAPMLAWTKGPHEAALLLGDAVRVELRYEVKSLDADKEAQPSAYRAKVAAVVAFLGVEVEAEESSDRTMLIGVTAGGAALLLGLIGFILARRSKRRQGEQLDALEGVRGDIELRLDAQKHEYIEHADREAKKAAEKARQPLAILLTTDGPMKGEQFALLKPRVIAGRDFDRCDLVFPSEGGDLGISRVHAEFTVGGGEWRASCLGDGGMSVNGVAVRKSEDYPIRIGDVVTLGHSSFKLELP